MDRTTAFDPNKTQLTPGSTAPGPMDPNRTQVMGAPPAGGGYDPLKTVAMAAVPMGKAVAVAITPGRDSAMANGPAREQFLLEITAAGMAPGIGATAGAGSRTAVNLCLVIDRSGSMEGQPLEYVKQAASHVVDLLGPDDILSIVTFEERADVLMEPQKVTQKESVKAGIARLMPGNTTNLHEGLTMGLDLVKRNMEGKRATRMIVLSDGDPTAGIKDFPSLTAFAGEIKNQGVSATFLGFGPDYNEELLSGMARRAGGTYAYVAQPQQLPEIFRNELGKLSTTVARNLRLAVKPARWVSLRAPLQAPSGQEVEMPLADLERGAALSQVIDVDMPNHPLGWYRVAAARLTYEDLLDGSTQTVDLDLVIEFTADAARYGAPQDPKVAASAEVQLVGKAVERTVMGMKTGVLNRTQALAELDKTQMFLAKEGRTSEAKEVTLAMQAIRSGDTSGAEKTLMGTALHLDQGKK